MENAYSAVIPAQAGIPWLRVLRDPCFRRDDGEEAFFDTLSGGKDSSGGRDHLPPEESNLGSLRGL